MAKRGTTSGRSNQSRTQTSRGRNAGGGGGRSRAVAGRKSPAGGRGSTRTAGGRTRTGGGGTTRAAGGTKSRGGTRSTATTGRSGTGVARRATGASRKSGSQTNRNRTARSTARTSKRPDQVRRPAGQMSEQEKRRTAASERPQTSPRSRRQQESETGVQRSQEETRTTGEFNQESVNQENPDEELYQRTTDYRQQKRIEEDVFAQPVQKANVWLKMVMDEIGLDDRHRAYTALKAVLHTLRDRLTVEEAVDLASQLPTFIRGIYFEGWKPSGKPIKYSKDEFISTVRGYFMNLSGMNHTEVIRGVFRVLRDNIAEGEINHVIGTMPEEFAELWMEEALIE